jgi:hypothetical protein
MESDSIRYRSTSRRVLSLVSEAENTPQHSLPPLSDAIDPDTLNDRSVSIDETDGNDAVSFVFSNSLVSLDHGGHIHIDVIEDGYVCEPDTVRAEVLKSKALAQLSETR